MWNMFKINDKIAERRPFFTIFSNDSIVELKQANSRSLVNSRWLHTKRTFRKSLVVKLMALWIDFNPFTHNVVKWPNML